MGSLVISLFPCQYIHKYIYTDTYTHTVYTHSLSHTQTSSVGLQRFITLALRPSFSSIITTPKHGKKEKAKHTQNTQLPTIKQKDTTIGEIKSRIKQPRRVFYFFWLNKLRKPQKQMTTTQTQVQIQKQSSEQLQTLMQAGQISGSLSFNGLMTKEDEEMSRSALSTFKAKEEEIEKKKLEVRERVQAQLGRIEEETRRLATIREELEALTDPMKKEVSVVRKKIDSVNKELKPLGQTCQKKEREYKEALDAFNEKNKEKVQLITRLMEQLVSESEKMRMKKLEELSKSVETIQ
ncbi:hypothetical protein L1987_61221 [Smallanthus sonchifolius]|uniref:Uncharacterized protein n=1 Tax=Smallanthus sonchifolius TaxID=185202 RepID=A0ACB9DAJ8_9ASTR|nr:hypothetical protein L1987_61221 [Smallanthus sonchifolius]